MVLNLAERSGPEISEAELFYRTHQLITYLGNKRTLLPMIESGVLEVKRRLGRNYLRIVDLFSGSGVVSRLLKAHASTLLSNDIEDYAVALAKCFLVNRGSVNRGELSDFVATLNNYVRAESMEPGFIQEMYAPLNEQCIQPSDRVFYTKENARRIDDYRRRMRTLPYPYYDLLLGPLLSLASVHVNTSGIFKGFHKDRKTGLGRFGGSGGDALKRILGEIELKPPTLSEYECEVIVCQHDANLLAGKLKNYDLVYLDPPYNQHPYGSNYFMLNLIVRYQRPQKVSKVSGIPVDWRRSGYNIRAQAPKLWGELLETIEAPFFLISANDEGYISPKQLMELLKRIGRVDVIESRYPAFRGCRSFRHRPKHVTEQLFLVERS